MSSFFKILDFAKPPMKYAYLNVLFNIFYALFTALSFVAFLPMLRVLFKETTAIRKEPIYLGISNLKSYLDEYSNYVITTQIDKHGEPIVLLYVIILVTIVFLLKNLFYYLAVTFITYFRHSIIRNLRNILYDKILRLNIAFFSEKRKGDVMSRMSNDISEIQFSYLAILEFLVRDPLTIIITLSLMFYISLELSLFVFVFIPLSGLLISKIGKTLRKHASKVQEQQGNVLTQLEETLNALKVIKSFSAENVFSNKFKSISSKQFSLNIKLFNRLNLASPLSEFLGVLVIGVLLWKGGQLVIVDNILNASSFMVYIGFAYNILTPAKSMSRVVYEIKKGNASAERILEFLKMENPIKEIDNPIKKTEFKHSISFKNVSFKYESQYVLKNISFEIFKGQTVAIVGPSGSGKSTIANLLTRFYDVEEGTIEFDGIDIKHLSKESLHNLTGFVLQDSILFNDTISNNIKLGNPDANDATIENASKVANAFEFIKKMPKKFNSNIGDSGNKLSGGQRQRLSIARSVLKNPPIMILDEATSALDTESEQLVQEAFENMMKNRTSIVIAHRLSTIQKADCIMVLKDGEIIEKGTHQELIAQKKLYANLFELQSI